MEQNLFELGLEKRKATLGAEYVEKNLAAADDFTRPFQEAMTAWCWGFGWGDDTLDARTRSLMNLSMIGALGKMHEWKVHCKGAITNGCSVEEIRESAPPATSSRFIAAFPRVWSVSARRGRYWRKRDCSDRAQCR
jgi:4-carboxymuconolactone decarboxylase